MASNSTNKRRRTAADTLHISDLPTGFIADVSAYLSKPSRALLAVAFTASPSSWKNDLMHRLPPISTAILAAQQWDILDFEDINEELASILTDDDLYAVLKCISAQDVLKKIMLAGCINITGHGLGPLRNSAVLELIDISIVGKYETPSFASTKLSQAAVLPILDSIISSVGCSLKYIQFPQNWRYIGTHNVSGEMHPIRGLRTRFNQYMYSRTSLGLDCSKCNRRMINAQEWLNGLFDNMMICYECLKPICTHCDMNERAGFCGHCKKKYCTDCTHVTSCVSCSECYCKCCGDMKACNECGETGCKNWLYTCGGCNRTLCDNQCVEMYHCKGENCSESHCQDCYNGKEYSVKHFEECQCEYCNGCKLDELKKDGVRCNVCAGDVADLMLEEMAKQSEEMTKLRNENEELREKVESLSL